jgi:hypothetical protein
MKRVLLLEMVARVINKLIQATWRQTMRLTRIPGVLSMNFHCSLCHPQHLIFFLFVVTADEPYILVVKDCYNMLLESASTFWRESPETGNRSLKLFLLQKFGPSALTEQEKVQQYCERNRIDGLLYRVRIMICGKLWTLCRCLRYVVCGVQSVWYKQ